MWLPGNRTTDGRMLTRLHSQVRLFVNSQNSRSKKKEWAESFFLRQCTLSFTSIRGCLLWRSVWLPPKLSSTCESRSLLRYHHNNIFLSWKTRQFTTPLRCYQNTRDVTNNVTPIIITLDTDLVIT